MSPKKENVPLKPMKGGKEKKVERYTSFLELDKKRFRKPSDEPPGKTDLFRSESPKGNKR